MSFCWTMEAVHVGETALRGATIKQRCRVGAWLLAAIPLAGCSRSEPGDVVRIGVVLPYTGNAAPIASSLERGVLTLTRNVNELHGGIDGRTIEIVFRDSASSAEIAADS